MIFRTTAIASVFSVLAGTAFAGNPLGTWRSAPNDEGKFLDMTITVCGNQLCGTIAKVHGGESGDTSVEGKQMLKGMNRYTEDNWDDGEIWAADTKKWYDSKMEMTSENDLTVSGCVGFGLICREVKWTRVQ